MAVQTVSTAVKSRPAKAGLKHRTPMSPDESVEIDLLFSIPGSGTRLRQLHDMARREGNSA